MSEWTVDTLKEMVDRRFEDSDKAVQAALVSAEKAVTAALTAAKEAVNKAEIATEKRFESVNEFRGQLADQSSNLLPRAEYASQHKAIEDKIQGLTDRMNLKDGASQGAEITWGKVYAFIIASAAAAAFVGHLIK
jgi:hypothetical protein